MKFQSAGLNHFKQQALQWAAGFNVCCHLDSNNFSDPYSKFDTLIAIDEKYAVTATAGNAFETLARFKEKYKEWMTGFFGYDLKNEVERLTSYNPDYLAFPDLYFFVPKHLILIKDNAINIQSDDSAGVFSAITKTKLHKPLAVSDVEIKTRFTKEEYVDNVNRIKEHINRGDIYVTNFCQEFYAENTLINPVNVFQKLNESSPNPFSCFFKYHDKYILCASPERFLARRGNKLISQPIKGTARRGANAVADEGIKKQLKDSLKEQQENVMIVDLVRNDLSRSAVPGTVKVEELYGIYSFKHLHQMISTVVCDLGEKFTGLKAIENSFPMGSMTGAPKIRAMELMEKYERTKRGAYSGAAGYFSPDGDFDFNVVIRSILYSAANKYLSFQAGSAIIHSADAEYEYNECLLKIKAILEVLAEPISSPQP